MKPTLKFLLYVLVLMPVRQYILYTAKTAQCSVRIIGALEYVVLNSDLMIPDFPHNTRIRLAELKFLFVAS